MLHNALRLEIALSIRAWGGSTLSSRWSQDHLDLEKIIIIYKFYYFIIFLSLKKIVTALNFFEAQHNQILDKIWQQT